MNNFGMPSLSSPRRSVGLKNFRVDKGCQPRRLDKCYDEYQVGDPVPAMDMQVTGIKSSGVDPGFIAQKIWKESDEQKLHDPQHKFFQKSQEYLKSHPKASAQDVRDHMMATEPKFQRKHYIKGLYKNPDLLGKVRVSKNLCFLKRSLFLETPREKNRQAIMEALGNDVYRMLGVACPKLKIFLSQYPNRARTPMLILDGAEAQGPKGEAFRILGGKDPSQSRVVDDCIPQRKIGPYDVKDLGRLKMVFYWLADFDAVGGSYDNLGYYLDKEEKKAILFHIDGRPLPPKPSALSRLISSDLMTHVKINTDAKIKSPKRTLKDLFIHYFHFDLFDDSSLRERIEGVRVIADPAVRALIRELFQDYLDAFAEGDLDFRAEIQQSLDRLFKRGDLIAEVFKDRLRLTDEQLDVIDRLEQIVSPTRKTSKNQLVETRSVVKTKRIEVIWDQSQAVFKARGQKAKKVMEKINAFSLSRLGHSLSPRVWSRQSKTGYPILELSPELLTIFTKSEPNEAFASSALMDSAHVPRTL